jgi:hypothetical protein
LNNKLKQAAFSSFVLVMKPIARVLLRCGVSWKELAELIKLVYVDVATEDYGKHGRPANASRVAILTGLSRRDVKRARDALEQSDNLAKLTFKRIDHATRVLSAWHQDRDFLTRSGKPRLLPQQGPGGFTALLKKYAPDIPPTAMLKELLEVGAVRETPGGRLRVGASYFMPAAMDVDSIVRSGSVLQDLAQTVVHNQLAASGAKRFEGRATNLHVKRGAKRAFHQFVEQRGMELLETVDTWLTEHEAGEKDEKANRYGVGVYLIMDE